MYILRSNVLKFICLFLLLSGCGGFGELLIANAVGGFIGTLAADKIGDLNDKETEQNDFVKTGIVVD